MAHTLGIRDEAYQCVEEYARAHNLSLAQAASTLILRGATPEGAAEVLLTCLPPAQQELIRTLAEQRNVSLASFLLSYAKLAWERGETSVAVTEVTDREAQRAGIRPGDTGVCEVCQKPFVAERFGQRMCTNVGDDGLTCARRRMLQTIHAERQQRLGRRPAPLMAP